MAWALVYENVPKKGIEVQVQKVHARKTRRHNQTKQVLAIELVSGQEERERRGYSCQFQAEKGRLYQEVLFSM